MKHDMGELIFFYMRVGEQSILCKREWADSHIWKNSILRIVHAWMGEVVLKQRNLKKKEKVKWQMAKSKKGEFAIDYWESSLKQESKWFLVIRDNSGSVGRYFFFFLQLVSVPKYQNNEVVWIYTIEKSKKIKYDDFRINQVD